MRKTFTKFLRLTGGDRKIGEITRREISDYVYVTHGHLSNVSKKNLLTNFSVLLNYSVKRDYLTTNPVEKIDRPTIPFVKPSLMSPDDFGKLLRQCHRKGWHDRLVIFVLVGFCGIRTEEASRLKWTNLDYDRKIVEVPASVAKKASFRNNVIPPNAMEWLELVRDKRRKGPLIGPNWQTRLRDAKVSAKIEYEKNSIRHSFCSYALSSKTWNLAVTREMVIAAEYTEVESGKKTDAERPQLHAALALCRKLNATLVVSKLDRLSRNALFLLQLQQANVDFICCDCPNVDRFTIGILALVAQRERELISERTKSALAQARQRGVRLGTKTPERQVQLMAVAYRKQRDAFVTKVSPVIVDIKKSGVSTLKGIAECLTRRGIPTRNGKSVWFGSSVKAVVG